LVRDDECVAPLLGSPASPTAVCSSSVPEGDACTTGVAGNTKVPEGRAEMAVGGADDDADDPAEEAREDAVRNGLFAEKGVTAPLVLALPLPLPLPLPAAVPTALAALCRPLLADSRGETWSRPEPLPLWPNTWPGNIAGVGRDDVGVGVGVGVALGAWSASEPGVFGESTGASELLP
jgi:hypothetical protein